MIRVESGDKGKPEGKVRKILNKLCFEIWTLTHTHIFTNPYTEREILCQKCCQNQNMFFSFSIFITKYFCQKKAKYIVFGKTTFFSELYLSSYHYENSEK